MNEHFTLFRPIQLCRHGDVPRTSLFRKQWIVPPACRDRDLGDGEHFGYFISAECPGSDTRPGGIVTTARRMTFLQMAVALVGEGTMAEVCRQIVEQGLDVTEAQWCDLVECGNKGMTLLMEGSWSLAFTQTGKQLDDRKGGTYPELAVLGARCYGDGQWDVDIRKLSNGHGWRAGRGLVLGNRLLSA